MIYFLHCHSWTEILIDWLPAFQKEWVSINKGGEILQLFIICDFKMFGKNERPYFHMNSDMPSGFSFFPSLCAGLHFGKVLHIGESFSSYIITFWVHMAQSK